jgi:hypothetical protein
MGSQSPNWFDPGLENSGLAAAVKSSTVADSLNNTLAASPILDAKQGFSSNLNSGTRRGPV